MAITGDINGVAVEAMMAIKMIGKNNCQRHQTSSDEYSYIYNIYILSIYIIYIYIN